MMKRRKLVSLAIALTAISVLAGCSSAKAPDLVSQSESDASSSLLAKRANDAMTFTGTDTGWKDFGQDSLSLPLEVNDLDNYSCMVSQGFGTSKDVGEGKSIGPDDNKAHGPKSLADAQKQADRLEAHWKKQGFSTSQQLDPQTGQTVQVFLNERETSIGVYFRKGNIEIEGWGLCAKDDDDY